MDDATPAPEDDYRSDPAFIAAMEAGIQSLEAGRRIDYEDVRRWLLSWGTDAELPPPECP